LGYQVKLGREEKLPDGKRRWVWDGAWEWKHLLEKRLPARSGLPGKL
jgi:hypothetical protein